MSRRAVAILAAAVALGLVYNSASPLGVRVGRPVENPAGTPAPTTGQTLRPVTTGPASVSTPGDLIPVLTWPQAKPLLAAGKILLIDGRTPAAYQIEHIPGAISLSVKSPPAEFAAFVTNYPKGTNIVVYCGSDMCDLSHELAVKLVRELGFTNVQEMPGGITEYLIFEGEPNQPGSR